MSEFSGEHTKEFFSKLYYNRSAIISIDQVQGMTRAVIGFCKCFKDTDKEILILNRIIHEPIKVVLEKYKSNFKDKDFIRLNFQKTLSELDWVFYRDSRFPTKLNKRYFFDADRPSFSKKMFFYDLANILGLVKVYVDEIYSDVASKNKFDFNFDVSAYSNKIQQVESVGNAEN